MIYSQFYQNKEQVFLDGLERTDMARSSLLLDLRKCNKIQAKRIQLLSLSRLDNAIQASDLKALYIFRDRNGPENKPFFP